MSRGRVLLLFLCGCVASQEHVEKGNDLNATLALRIASKFPEDEILAYHADALRKHADEPAGLPLVAKSEDLLGMVGGYPGASAIGVGIITALTGGGYFAGRKKKPP